VHNHECLNLILSRAPRALTEKAQSIPVGMEERFQMLYHMFLM